MHVGVDQPWQQGMPAGVDHLARSILCLQIGGGADGNDRVATHGDGAVRKIADALIAISPGTGHRKHVGMNQ